MRSPPPHRAFQDASKEVLHQSLQTERRKYFPALPRRGLFEQPGEQSKEDDGGEKQ